MTSVKFRPQGAGIGPPQMD